MHERRAVHRVQPETIRHFLACRLQALHGSSHGGEMTAAAPATPANIRRSCWHSCLISEGIPRKRGITICKLFFSWLGRIDHSNSFSIVFSSWKKTLKLVGELLGSHAIRYDLIDGSLSLSDRLKVLKDFRSPAGANVLLMTLGTGAVG